MPSAQDLVRRTLQLSARRQLRPSWHPALEAQPFRQGRPGRIVWLSREFRTDAEPGACRSGALIQPDSATSHLARVKYRYPLCTALSISSPHTLYCICPFRARSHNGIFFVSSLHWQLDRDGSRGGTSIGQSPRGVQSLESIHLTE